MPPPANKRQRQQQDNYHQQHSSSSSSSHHQHQRGGGGHHQQQHGSSRGGSGDSRGHGSQQQRGNRSGTQQAHHSSASGGEAVSASSIRRREPPPTEVAVHKIELPPPVPSVADFYCAEDELASKLTNPGILAESAELIGTLRAMLTASAPVTVDDANPARDALLVKAIKLRRLNRLSNFRNRLLRNTVAEARERAEDAYLQLANVKSEIGHLRRAIDGCLEAQSDDADIELVPPEEFFESAPPEIKRDEPTLRVDEHQLHLARLNYELWERKNMVSTLQELEGRRGVLLSDIRGKEQRLGQIPPRINALKDAAQPLLDLLGMGKKLGRAEFDIRAKMEHLPARLKPVHIQLEVYNKIMDGEEPVEISCEGSVEEVGKFNANLIAEEELDEPMEDVDEEREDTPEGEENGPAEPPTSAPEDEEAPISHNELNQKDATTSNKRSRRSHHSLSASIAEKLERKRRALLSTHPISLTVGIPVSAGEKGSRCTLRFTYAPQLQCVFVKCQLEGVDLKREEQAKNALLAEDSLLNELFAGDDGQECPSEVGQSLAEMFGLDLAEQFLTIGKPYRWAQRLAGLISPSSTYSSTSTEPSAMQHFEWTVECVQRVRERLESRLAISRWVKAMAAGGVKPVGPGKSLCRIDSFNAHLAMGDLREFVATSLNPLHETMLAEWEDEGSLESGFLFSTELARQAFRLRAMIYVPVNYPREQSVVMLATASDAHKGWMELTKGVWELERYVNCIVPQHVEAQIVGESARYSVVSAQLAAVLSRLDAVLEIAAKRVGSVDFQVTHLYMATSCAGRQQCYPLHFDEITGSFSSP